MTTIMNEFKTYHPIVNFIYFLAVIVFSMFLMHPVCLGISLVCCLAYSIILGGVKAVKFNFAVLIPLLLFAGVINPLFNHEGVTILAYFPSGNPLTLESIIYGLAAAVMLVTVICWFSCYNAVMTSDKFIYLFGKVIPSMSLILSMALRFVPRFKTQFKEIADARRCTGHDISSGSLLNRGKEAAAVLSAMISLSMENSIETANSMKSRGYGLKGRSSFSIFRFERRDGLSLLIIFFLSAYIIAGCALKKLTFRYFPSFGTFDTSLYSVSIYAAYFLLCILPVLIEIREGLRWKSLKLKI